MKKWPEMARKGPFWPVLARKGPFWPVFYNMYYVYFEFKKNKYIHNIYNI